MTSEHFENVVVAYLDRKPFKPFTVELVGGQHFEIDHARAVALSDGIAVYIAPGGAPVWFDHEGVVTIVGDTAQSSAE